MRSTFKETIAATVLAATLAFPVAAFAATGTAPSIIAMGQKAKGHSVSIEYAYLPKDGYLVIHPSDKHGKMRSNVIGQEQLAAGSHDHVSVKLDVPIKSGQTFWAELQQKPFANGSSHPFQDNGTPVQESFVIQ